MKLLGLVGCGTMGRPMAENLLKAGYRLLVCDKNSDAVESLSRLGAGAVATPAELASTPGEEGCGEERRGRHLRVLLSAAAPHAPSRAACCLLPAAAGMHAIFSMLPSPDAVSEAYRGAQGILSVGPGSLHPHLLIDSSTIDPLTAREVAAAVESTTLHPDSAAAHKGSPRPPFFLDAPVSGGNAAAASATLTFMVRT